MISILKLARHQAGYHSQLALAKELGINEKSISAYETGRAQVPTELAFKMAKLFNKPLEELFPGRFGNEVLQ